MQEIQRVPKGQWYWTVFEDGHLTAQKVRETGHTFDEEMYKAGKYFPDKRQAESYIALLRRQRREELQRQAALKAAEERVQILRLVSERNKANPRGHLRQESR